MVVVRRLAVLAGLALVVVAVVLVLGRDDEPSAGVPLVPTPPSDGNFQAVADPFAWNAERAGDFAPLRFLPKGKRVILGLVSTKTPQLESKDALKRRIDEAARHVPLEQLGIGPQCGFSTSAATHLTVTEEIEKAKLARIVEVARAVWGTA